MDVVKFTSYSGDTYERRQTDSGRTEYRRIKKARDLEWTPAPRVISTSEMMQQLRDENQRLTALCSDLRAENTIIREHWVKLEGERNAADALCEEYRGERDECLDLATKMRVERDEARHALTRARAEGLEAGAVIAESEPFMDWRIAAAIRGAAKGEQ